MLEENGFQVVISAGNGKELIDLAMEIKIKSDIYLTDLNMPVMHGLETRVEIIRRWPDAKIVILSSELPQYYILEAQLAGASAVLHKLFHYNDIAPALKLIHRFGTTNIGT
jgi:DNA-binding NarL/FixJ family response regulator